MLPSMMFVVVKINSWKYENNVQFNFFFLASILEIQWISSFLLCLRCRFRRCYCWHTHWRWHQHFRWILYRLRVVAVQTRWLEIVQTELGKCLWCNRIDRSVFKIKIVRIFTSLCCVNSGFTHRFFFCTNLGNFSGLGRAHTEQK